MAKGNIYGKVNVPTKLKIYQGEKTDTADVIISNNKISVNVDVEEVTKDCASKEDLNDKQDKLVSGSNIQTINGKSILKSGNLSIESGSKIYLLTFYDLFPAPYHAYFDDVRLQEMLTQMSTVLQTEVTVENLSEIFASLEIGYKCLFWSIIPVYSFKIDYDGIEVLRQHWNESDTDVPMLMALCEFDINNNYTPRLYTVSVGQSQISGTPYITLQLL